MINAPQYKHALLRMEEGTSLNVFFGLRVGGGLLINQSTNQEMRHPELPKNACVQPILVLS